MLAIKKYNISTRKIGQSTRKTTVLICDNNMYKEIPLFSCNETKIGAIRTNNFCTNIDARNAHV